jgi:hypothetical protein
MAVSIPLKGSLSASCEKIEDLEDLMDEHRILKQLIERLVERGLEVDLAHYLRYAGCEPAVNLTSNAYTGKSQKTVKRPFAVRGSRCGRFAPWINVKHLAGYSGFGYKIPPLRIDRTPVYKIQARSADMHGAWSSFARASAIIGVFIKGLGAG